MRLIALTFGGPETASTHYRWLQYTDHFREAGVEFHHEPVSQFKDPKALASYDVVVLQKTLISGSRLRSIRRYARRLIYDVDDLIWLSPTRRHSLLTRWRIEWRLRRIVRSADLCIAANQVIADDLVQRGGKTHILPMALDGRQWKDAVKPAHPLTIGWSGAPKNLHFLRAILNPLQRLQSAHPDVRWVIHCGEDPRFEGFRYEHIPFVPGKEPAAVQQFHIGLLPLEDAAFARGKSPIKTLQYFASRVAVVGSGVGAALEMLKDGVTGLTVEETKEWEPVLDRLLRDRRLIDQLAARGRQSFEGNHEAQAVHRLLMKLLNAL
jgi:glycosyltransferase involved in cell wall biosynthesis